MIRQATLADIDAIVEIDQHSFPKPWARSVFEGELARDVARIAVVVQAPASPGRAAPRSGVEVDERGVIAFANYWLVAGELHVHAIATHPDHRRSGIAGELLAYALNDGRMNHCTIATLEVRRGNKPAIALYERAGFVTVHVRQRYYQDNNEDALVMTCDLTRPRP